ncbi:Hpt domain-containing protein [Rhizobium oryzicola]|uniref:Hpt domain-containing protein n=1 Tax=Rhizobium oryzicola TaxID=1232668 RepID=A0ABT8T1F8_9HYPH|nr:Hpt domain-containing protein [Rhizobium oryzicola]MDO1584552.1 Hpt domain-containing protein [Rhizobium oryzicola]
MAAVSIAFEAPDNARGATPSNSRPIDLVHLAVQTMGDKNLEIEVLHLFARQARAALQEIGQGSPDAISAAAHRLRSAANAVGAFRVASYCEAVEASSKDAALLAALGASVVEAENFILKLSR